MLTSNAKDESDKYALTLGRERALRTVIKEAANLASFCEHVEHNEPTRTDVVAHASTQLRRTAQNLASASGLSLKDLYASRIRAVEEASFLATAPLPGNTTNFDGANAAQKASTWQHLQTAQLLHDRQFHPDVFGLSKIDQVRHYTFHVTKLAGLLAEAIDNEDWSAFEQTRLADIAIFAVKTATVCNVRLPETPIDSAENSCE